MKATIKNIEIRNFKGIAYAKKDFDEILEILKAENGGGKSTFKYAFDWVLGHNVPDVIPMIDNKEIPNLEISVIITLNINDYDYIFKRIQKEIYRTNRDTGEKVKTNNESVFSIDGIEMSQKDYKEKLASLFGASYENLEMLTNKEYFNNKMKWQERRQMLFQLCEIDNIVQSLADKKEYSLISEEIKKGYSTNDIKKSLRKERLGYLHKQETNDTILQDKLQEIAKHSNINFAELKKERELTQEQLAKLQMASKEQSVNYIFEEKQKELNSLLTEQSNLRFKCLQDRNSKKRELDNLYYDLEKIKSGGTQLKIDIEKLIEQNELYSKELNNIEKTEFNSDLKCSLCGQALPQDKVANAKNEFEKEKSNKIIKYSELINKNNELINTKNIEIAEQRENYKIKLEEYNKLKAEFETMENVEDVGLGLSERIESLKKEIASISSTNIEKPLENEMRALQDKIKELNNAIVYERVINESKERVKELKQENIELADKVALCERKEKALEDYIREQVSLVNNTINNKFSNGVSFTLFNELYKGGEGGLEETCICMYNGKVYSSMSTGERYLADLEVVKTLQKEFKVNLPIFCDNAECFTKEYEADQQIIEMYAEKGKKLDGVVYIESIL